VNGTAPINVVNGNTASIQRGRPPSQKTGRLQKAATEKGTRKSQSLLQTRLEEITIRLCDEKNVYSSGLKVELLSTCRSVESPRVVIQCLRKVVEGQNMKLGKA